MIADQTGLSQPTAMHFRHKFPVDAEYAFLPTIGVKKSGGVNKPGGVTTPETASGQELHLGLWIDGALATTLDGETGKRAEIRTAVSAGEHTISISYVKPSGGGRINQVEVDGPFHAVSGPERPIPPPGGAPTYLANLARRAFRRPVTTHEVERYTALIALAQSKGDSYQDGLALAIQAILVSPQFLFRIEPDPKAKSPRALTALELASRLSFFLWSSIPDDELLRVAENGSLTKPAVLEAQVRRMLRDQNPSALQRTSPASGWKSAAWNPSSRTPPVFPNSTTCCATRCAGKPSCSSTESCAKTGASSNLLTRSIPI